LNRKEIGATITVLIGIDQCDQGKERKDGVQPGDEQQYVKKGRCFTEEGRPFDIFDVRSKQAHLLLLRDELANMPQACGTSCGGGGRVCSALGAEARPVYAHRPCNDRWDALQPHGKPSSRHGFRSEP
jgi:hypothetical protein